MSHEPTWQVVETDPDEGVVADSRSALASFHFLRKALRRRIRLCLAFAIGGLLLGVALTVVMPPSQTGTVTVLLAHDPSLDPTQAMATDVSLLGTREVAKVVIDRLHLQLDPDSFQRSITATTSSPQILVIDVAAPSASAAIQRADAVATGFLSFRTAQLRSQTQGAVRGYQSRIDNLQDQISRLTTQYNAVSRRGAAGQTEASSLLTERSQLTSQVSSLQQTIETTTLQANAIIGASHVVDDASVVPASAKRRAVLNSASGLIGGTALGAGLVIFLALVSDRLRRREEVALALGTWVTTSITSTGFLGRAHSSREMWRPIQRVKRIFRGDAGERRDLDVLVTGLERAVASSPGVRVANGERTRASRRNHGQRLAVLTIDAEREGAAAVAGLAERLCERDMTVALIDLSTDGNLSSVFADSGSQGQAMDRTAITVHRPEGEPTLARGPLRTARSRRNAAQDQEFERVWASADITVALGLADAAIGFDYLNTWADEVVLMVRAGSSTAEMLRTAAELLRLADLNLMFAMMVGADTTDESLGSPDLGDQPQGGSHASPGL